MFFYHFLVVFTRFMSGMECEFLRLWKSIFPSSWIVYRKFVKCLFIECLQFLYVQNLRKLNNFKLFRLFKGPKWESWKFAKRNYQWEFLFFYTNMYSRTRINLHFLGHKIGPNFAPFLVRGALLAMYLKILNKLFHNKKYSRL